jgi:hypothetical protein
MAERSKAPDSSLVFSQQTGSVFWSRKRRGFESPSCQHSFSPFYPPSRSHCTHPIHHSPRTGNQPIGLAEPLQKQTDPWHLPAAPEIPLSAQPRRRDRRSMDGCAPWLGIGWMFRRRRALVSCCTYRLGGYTHMHAYSTLLPTAATPPASRFYGR